MKASAPVATSCGNLFNQNALETFLHDSVVFGLFRGKKKGENTAIRKVEDDLGAKRQEHSFALQQNVRRLCFFLTQRHKILLS